MAKNKRLIVVGDRVLVKTEDGDQRSKVGLYLPPTAVDNQAVQGGEIVSTGPGLALPDLAEQGEEPWRIGGASHREARYVPTVSYTHLDVYKRRGRDSGDEAD